MIIIVVGKKIDLLWNGGEANHMVAAKTAI